MLPGPMCIPRSAVARLCMWSVRHRAKDSNWGLAAEQQGQKTAFWGLTLRPTGIWDEKLEQGRNTPVTHGEKHTTSSTTTELFILMPKLWVLNAKVKRYTSAECVSLNLVPPLLVFLFIFTVTVWTDRALDMNRYCSCLTLYDILWNHNIKAIKCLIFI